jgi:hypothetical protein
MESNEILITGYAKLPQGITAKELYSVIAVGVIVEKNSGVIIDSDCSLATQIAKDFVRSILVGCSLSDIDYGSARKAIISAVKTCAEKYKQICENGDEYTED